ncbi:ecdysone oxidase-like [Oppia nitens]|uniref:ecdysone oxidase-like n=1 Tax=Oppia nitens TaxID=1686743 RepID=UPI0023DB730C|nr:ecdysone oxidase-like [Oppia nitens]
MAVLNVISIIGLSIIAITIKRQYDHQNVENINKFNVNNKKFDYIVVGAGAAGAIVAYRLADETGSTVLLLEAGGSQNLYNDIPALQEIVENGVQNWKYPTNETQHIDAGRVFGGSSAINSMNYYRESPEYYRLWTEITGLSEWTFDKVLPYFLKSENNLDHKLVAENSGYHRTGGRVTVTSSESNAMMKQVMIEAEMLGHKKTFGDGREPMGAAVLQNTIDTNRSRVSTGTAFLENNCLKNLNILGNSLVTKIIFNNRKQAIGVEFSRYGKKYLVFANKEVILSVGSIGSSKLLMLSGVGPRDHLKQFGISVITDLNVGHYFVHSMGTNMIFDIINQSMVMAPTNTFKNVVDYYIRHTGPLGYNQSTIICFPELAYSRTYPDLSNGCVMARTGLLGNRTVLQFLAFLRRPKTIGHIELTSGNPFTAPIVKTCKLCHKSDIDNLVNVIKLALPIFTSDHMKQYIKINAIADCYPCNGNYFCDQYLRCIVQKNTKLLIPLGGCRMGVSPDNGAVVDKNFKVFGVHGLRVIDSSIIPVPCEQGNAISMMIGEYGAHTVIENK